MGDFFHFSEDTIKHFIENKYIELWTARANKEVLLSRNTLSHLRDGIAYLCDKYQSGWFIGKMTISALYDEVAAAFALFYLEKFFSSKSLGEAPYPKKEVEYLWREGRSDEIMTLFNTCMTHFTGDFSWHDRRQVRDIIKLFSNAPRFPDMFPFYFDKLETLDYIWTIQNGKVREAWIVVDKSKVKKDQAEKHFANVEKWKAEAEGAQLTVAEYVEKYPIAA